MKLKDFDFRIWDNQTNKFVEVLISDNIRAVPRKNDDLVLELWCGMIDKNGKKIYEGDIVCFKNRGKYNDDRDEVLAKHIKEKCLKKTFLAQIFFENEGGGYCIKCKTKRGHTKYFSLFDMFFYLDFTLKVVGNIHENAELLDNHNKEQKCH